jgi:AraC-like DNA-binding protein
MRPAVRVAFVSHLRSGYFQRLTRGACRAADEHGGIVVREFPVSLRPASGFLRQPAERTLAAWRPAGVLAGLMDRSLGPLLKILRARPPVVNTMACTPRPGLTVVSGSTDATIARAVALFRQSGVRSPSFLCLESGAAERAARQALRRAAGGIDPGRALLVEPVDVDVVEDPEAPVAPIPRRLRAWLRGLARPAGVLCFQLGGGGYLIRACRELGLRVPEDVAVIGGDDADLSLRSEPTLTSILPSAEQVGYEAMKVLIRMMGGGSAPAGTVRVEATELHVRQSTARPRETGDTAAAMEYIGRHACEGIRVEDVLDRTQAVSRMTFYREFRKATGRSPGEAIRDRQLEEACRLLRQTSFSMSRVAEACGFSDASAFARTFRACRGLAPSAFRRRGRPGRV